MASVARWRADFAAARLVRGQQTITSVTSVADQTARKPFTTKVPALDGLRGLAVLLVIWHHLGFALEAHAQDLGSVGLLLTSYCFIGLVLFFILSGFLLFLPYARAILTGSPWPSARQFYLRRARRILPVYYIVVGTFLLIVFLSSLFSGSGSAIFHGTGFTWLLWLVLPLYDVNLSAFLIVYTLDGPLWSLAVECQFYLFLPLLALVLRRAAGHAGPRERFYRLVLTLCGLMALGLALRAGVTVAHYQCPDGGDAFRAPCGMQALYGIAYGVKGKYWEMFALGMLASMFYVVAVEQQRVSAHILRRLGLPLAGLCVVGLFACFVWALLSTRLPYNWLYPASAKGWPWAVFGEWVIGASFTCLMLSALLTPSIGRFFSWKPLRWSGIISYSLYLWHEPFILLLIPAAPAIASSLPSSWSLNPLQIGGICLLVFTLGALSYRFIEHPFLLSRRAAPRASPAI